MQFKRFSRASLKVSFLSSLLCFLISSCNSEDSKTYEELLEGRWKIIQHNEEEVITKEGIIFAPNHQYFNVDSQGKAIPRLIEKMWKINSDTLIMIDYNWEPEFVEKNGTQEFLIELLDENKLHLKALRVKEEIIYEKI